MPDINSIIFDAANRYGIDPNYMLRTGQIESSLNPSDVNPHSGAAGLFQFIPSTARRYGLADPLDPVANADAMARFTRDNMGVLRNTLGRDPTPGELYLAHQQGAGGAMKLLSNPDAPAASLVGTRAVTLNGGQPGMTGQQFAGLWLNRFGGQGNSAPSGGSTIAQSAVGQRPSAPTGLGDMFASAAPAMSGGLTPASLTNSLAMSYMTDAEQQAKLRKAQAHAQRQTQLAALFAQPPATI